LECAIRAYIMISSQAYLTRRNDLISLAVCRPFNVDEMNAILVELSKFSMVRIECKWDRFPFTVIPVFNGLIEYWGERVCG